MTFFIYLNFFCLTDTLNLDFIALRLPQPSHTSNKYAAGNYIDVIMVFMSFIYLIPLLGLFSCNKKIKACFFAG